MRELLFFKISLYFVAAENVIRFKSRTKWVYNICCQTVLSDRKKKDHEKHLPYSARIRWLPDGKCGKQNIFVQHTAHPTHERIEQIMDEIIKKLKIFESITYMMLNRHFFQRNVDVWFLLSSTTKRCQPPGKSMLVEDRFWSLTISPVI